MSKEQTPITVKEFYYKWQTQDFKHKKIEIPNFTEEELLNFGEQYAQYRERKDVLEALEREVPKAFYKGFTVNTWWEGRYLNSIPIHKTIEEEIERFNQITKYYDTEVKPKYKQINK